MKKRRKKAARKTTLPGMSEDKQSGGFHVPHRVCPETGMYRGRQVISVATDE